MSERVLRRLQQCKSGSKSCFRGDSSGLSFHILPIYGPQRIALNFFVFMSDYAKVKLLKVACRIVFSIWGELVYVPSQTEVYRKISEYPVICSDLDTYNAIALKKVVDCSNAYLRFQILRSGNHFLVEGHMLKILEALLLFIFVRLVLRLLLARFCASRQGLLLWQTLSSIGHCQ